MHLIHPERDHVTIFVPIVTFLFFILFFKIKKTPKAEFKEYWIYPPMFQLWQTEEQLIKRIERVTKEEEYFVSDIGSPITFGKSKEEFDRFILSYVIDRHVFRGQVSLYVKMCLGRSEECGLAELSSDIRRGIFRWIFRIVLKETDILKILEPLVEQLNEN